MEIFISILLVIFAVFVLYKTITGKKNGCGCSDDSKTSGCSGCSGCSGSCMSCPSKSNKDKQNK